MELYMQYKNLKGRLTFFLQFINFMQYLLSPFCNLNEVYDFNHFRVSDISIISDKTNPMRIFMTGDITWNPAGIYEVSCESDTTYYPLDTQECSVKVTAWAYTSTEVTLQIHDEPVDLSFYSANGEWDLVSTSGEKTNDKSRGGTSFSALTFKLKLRRRPMFHVLNTLFPVALMAVLIAMVFKLDVESGEKIGFSLTVLLAYAVYLTMISDNIPSTSVTVCFLCKCRTCCLLQIIGVFYRN